MVSRSNLSGRAPYGGILGRVYKGPSGPGKITPPGMEQQVRKRGRRLLEGRDSGPIDADGVTAPGTETPAPPSKPTRGGGLSSMVQKALAAQSAPPAMNPIQIGVQPEAGGNVTTGIPRRMGSAASRRINR